MSPARHPGAPSQAPLRVGQPVPHVTENSLNCTYPPFTALERNVRRKRQLVAAWQQHQHYWCCWRPGNNRLILKILDWGLERSWRSGQTDRSYLLFIYFYHLMPEVIEFKCYSVKLLEDVIMIAGPRVNLDGSPFIGQKTFEFRVQSYWKI